MYRTILDFKSKQMNYKILLQVFFVGFYVAACISPYNPDISKYENILVVDSEISNLPGPYLVMLSRSYTYHKKTSEPVIGAKVRIIENTGRVVELNEVSDGIYSTINNSFQGIVGNSYKLQIVVDGNTYESDFETIKAPVPIDKVYWAYSVNENSKSIDILVDAHDPNNKTHYYGWDFTETWKFKVPFLNPDTHPDWETCYRSNESVKFLILSTSNRNNDIVEQFKLSSIDEGTNKLYIRYSILVKQYSLNEQAYKFLKT
jgi:hypothetical protein